MTDTSSKAIPSDGLDWERRPAFGLEDVRRVKAKITLEGLPETPHMDVLVVLEALHYFERMLMGPAAELSDREAP